MREKKREEVRWGSDLEGAGGGVEYIGEHGEHGHNGGSSRGKFQGTRTVPGQ